MGVNVLCGLGQVNSYPFLIYPTFAGRADSTATTLRVEGRTRSGRTINVLKGAQNHEQLTFVSGRFRGLLTSILKVDDSEKRNEKLRALWSVLRDQRPEFRSIVTLRFYRATYSVNPDRSADPLLSTSLLATMDVSNAGDS